MIYDIDELIKFHRKRTFSSMLHWDLIVNDQLKHGKACYELQTNSVLHPEARTLTSKDTQVTIASVEESRVDVHKQAITQFRKSMDTIHNIQIVIELLRHILSMARLILQDINKVTVVEVAMHKLNSSYNQIYSSKVCIKKPSYKRSIFSSELPTLRDSKIADSISFLNSTL